MRRLTEYIGKDSDKPQAVPLMSDTKIGTQDCLNKLAEYEDLEEKGLLKRIPEQITNREWLNGLSDEDFTEWCFGYDVLDESKTAFKQPCPKLNTFQTLSKQKEFKFRDFLPEFIKWLQTKR